MTTTFSALKVWLTVAVVIFAAGCAKKNDDNNNNYGGYNGSYPGGPGYPGGGYGGGSVTPGGTLATAAARSYMSDGLTVDMEITFVALSGVSAGTSSNATARGRIRMNRADQLCGMYFQTPIEMQILEGQSQVTFNNGSANYQTVSGTLIASGPQGPVRIVLYNALLNVAAGNGPAISAWGNQFPFFLSGTAIPGTCNDPMQGWPLQPM